MLGGGEDRIEKQHKDRKLTARERVDLLLDRKALLNWIASSHTGARIWYGKQDFYGDGVVTAMAR